MKKKNLIILLLIPFIISLLGIVTINISINTFYGDISSIECDYDEIEAFELKEDKRYKLEATAKNSSNAPLDSGNTLIWTCENVDTTIEEKVAEIVYDEEEESYFLNPLNPGEAIVTCSNLKGNIFKKMTVIIYKDGVIIVKPKISGSQNNIDSNIYYGQYDFDGNKKVNATVDFTVECIPSKLSETLSFKAQSDNVQFNINNKRLTINGEGESYFSLTSNGITSTYNFIVVKDGINVYTYDDLLKCTNKSENGEIVVLRKSFETLDTYNDSKTNNIELFGNYSKSDKKFKFNDEIYKFETTYNKEYIKQWNNFAKENRNYSEIGSELIAGLRVQKDFYGNGYTINMHNLTYPSLITSVQVDGVDIEIPTLGLDDLYRGPLPFYTLGDPNGLPLVTAYGQDNVGMYVDGDNITINDVNLLNAELKGSMSFLDTVGTVMEVNGDNVKVMNSRLSNGKNVLRCFSTNNFTLSNSLLSNSRNFLLEAGSNEFMSYDEVSKYTFTSSEGVETTTTISEYLNTKGQYGDLDFGNYITGAFTDSKIMYNSIVSIQTALNGNTDISNQYKGSITIDDTYFYNSGISSIALNSMFNGPFLYNAIPSQITDIFSMMSMEGKPVIPITPSKVGGTSYPISLSLEGKTKFFDYKTPSNLDITGLINENISVIAKEVFGKDREISIDDIFPIKPMLMNEARKAKSTYSNGGKEYVNVPIAYYGGGLNLSTVNIANLEEKENFSQNIEVNFFESYLNPSDGGDVLSQMRDVMLKCVTIVTGFEPFKFVSLKGNGYLFGDTPKVADLIANAKGE